MKLKLLVYFFILFFIFSSISLAQTPLNPAETEFEIRPIFLRGEGVYISGNTSYIAAYVQAYYPDFSYKKIGMDCYLNGDEFTATQNCSVQFYPERGVCSILFPQYLSLTSENVMKCKIYDPVYPLFTSMYINRSFTPINFSLWFSGYSAMVGERFNFPVNIKNSGLFSDNYNLTACIIEGGACIIEGGRWVVIDPATKSFLVELHGDAFDPHFWNRTGPGVKQVYIKTMILDASSNIQLCVNITSSINPGSSLRNCVTLKAQFKSLPEFSLLQFLFIMSAAAIFILKHKKIF